MCYASDIKINCWSNSQNKRSMHPYKVWNITNLFTLYQVNLHSDKQENKNKKRQKHIGLCAMLFASIAMCSAMEPSSFEPNTPNISSPISKPFTALPFSFTIPTTSYPTPEGNLSFKKLFMLPFII